MDVDFLVQNLKEIISIAYLYQRPNYHFKDMDCKKDNQKIDHVDKEEISVIYRVNYQNDYI